MKTVTFQVYPDSGDNYRWRAVARNKKITAVSGESFASKQNAERAALAFARSFGSTSCKVTVNHMECADTRGKVVKTKIVLPKV